MKNRITAIWYALAASLMIVYNCSARTEATTESRVAGRIAVVIEQAIRENQGLWPTNWGQLSDQLVSNSREMLDNGNEVIPAAYVFTPNNLYKSDFREGHVIAVRSKPIKVDGRQGRYVIYERPNKEIWTDWMREEEFQEMLTQSGVKLPDPNPTEVLAAQEAVKKVIAEEERIRQIIRQNAPQPTWGEIRAAWWGRIKGIFVKPAQSAFEEGLTGTSQTGQIRLVPVTIGLVGLITLLFLAFRWWNKRKPALCEK